MSRKRKAGALCPRLNRPCIEADCKFWINVQGRNPVDDSIVDRWDCTDVWKIMLNIENTKRMNELGAAIESFRNEMVKGNEKALSLHLHEANKRLQIVHDLDADRHSSERRGLPHRSR